MNFSLTPGLEQFVRDRARSGDYNNASEVVREALRLFRRVEELRASRMKRLQTARDDAGDGPAEDPDALPVADGEGATRDAVLETLRRHESDLRARGVRGLLLFGSLLHGTYGPHSDVDVVIEVDPADGFDLVDLAGVAGHLQELCRRPVDVLTRDGIDPAIRERVMAEAAQVF